MLSLACIVFLTTWFLLNWSLIESCRRQHSLNTPINIVLARACFPNIHYGGVVGVIKIWGIQIPEFPFKLLNTALCEKGIYYNQIQSWGGGRRIKGTADQTMTHKNPGQITQLWHIQLSYECMRGSTLWHSAPHYLSSRSPPPSSRWHPMFTK